MTVPMAPTRKTARTWPAVHVAWPANSNAKMVNAFQDPSNVIVTTIVKMDPTRLVAPSQPSLNLHQHQSNFDPVKHSTLHAVPLAFQRRLSCGVWTGVTFQRNASPPHRMVTVRWRATTFKSATRVLIRARVWIQWIQHSLCRTPFWRCQTMRSDHQTLIPIWQPCARMDISTTVLVEPTSVSVVSVSVHRHNVKALICSPLHCHRQWPRWPLSVWSDHGTEPVQ